ncbi:hypothetical protein [Ruminococcus sp.]|uniref:hypothetical protein n=1 Tax=Ruminococcus sp. TaxID=41978 RepID=UPI0025E966D3|nr:hypothetical protein [Ruminococcus sp.]
MKKLKRIGLLIFSILLIVVIINIIYLRLHDISKNYISIMNSNAKSVLKCIESNNYNFDNYCKNYNIPQNETAYISGTITSYHDMIIDANKYCNERKNITVNPTIERKTSFYWIIKIDNNKVSEIWTCNVPLNYSQLKSYSFNEQVDMMPLLRKDKFNYAIGYYNVDKPLS